DLRREQEGEQAGTRADVGDVHALADAGERGDPRAVHEDLAALALEPLAVPGDVEVGIEEVGVDPRLDAGFPGARAAAAGRAGEHRAEDGPTDRGRRAHGASLSLPERRGNDRPAVARTLAFAPQLGRRRLVPSKWCRS